MSAHSTAWWMSSNSSEGVDEPDFHFLSNSKLTSSSKSKTNSASVVERHENGEGRGGMGGWMEDCMRREEGEREKGCQIEA